MFWSSQLEGNNAVSLHELARGYFLHITWLIIGISPNVNLKCDVADECAIIAGPIYEEERQRKKWLQPKMLSVLILNHSRNTTLLRITLDGVRNDTLGWLRHAPPGNWISPETSEKKRVGLKRILASCRRVNLNPETGLRNTNAAKCRSARQTSGKRRRRSFADSLFGSLSGFPWPFAGEGQESRALLTVRPTNKT